MGRVVRHQAPDSNLVTLVCGRTRRNRSRSTLWLTGVDTGSIPPKSVPKKYGRNRVDSGDGLRAQIVSEHDDLDQADCRVEMALSRKSPGCIDDFVEQSKVAMLKGKLCC